MAPIEMKVSGLMMDPLTNMPIVILKNEVGDRLLPIWVGPFEAQAIAMKRENVEAPMLDRPAAPEERRARAERLLRTLGLGHRLRHRPAELAAADRQRLAVAVALANGPALLLADEPADELDRRTAQDLLGELGALLREHGTTAVMASRDAGLGRFVDRTVELWAPDGGA